MLLYSNISNLTLNLKYFKSKIVYLNLCSTIHEYE